MEQVASMPHSADNDFEVPLTAAEIDQIGRAITNTHELVAIVRGYGASHPEAFGGVFVDGRTVVLLMKGLVETYAEELRKLVPAGAPVDVRAASYTLPELEAKAAGIFRDGNWFAGQRLELDGAEVGADGHVQLRYRGGVGEEADLIAEHYGRPDWLTVSWEGPAQWKGPVGTVRLMVRDQDGRPVADAYCIVEPVDPSISYEPGVAFTTNKDGVCRLPYVPAVKVVAKVWRQGQPLQGAPAGDERATVPPNREVPVTVVLEPMP
jgi:hypothetical protein